MLPVLKTQWSRSKKWEQRIISPLSVPFSPSRTPRTVFLLDLMDLSLSLFSPHDFQDFFFFCFEVLRFVILGYQFKSQQGLSSSLVNWEITLLSFRKFFYAVLDAPYVYYFSVQVVILFSKQLCFARCVFSLFLLNLLSKQLDPLRSVAALLCQLTWGLGLVVGSILSRGSSTRGGKQSGCSSGGL